MAGFCSPKGTDSAQAPSTPSPAVGAAACVTLAGLLAAPVPIGVKPITRRGSGRATGLAIAAAVVEDDEDDIAPALAEAPKPLRTPPRMPPRSELPVPRGGAPVAPAPIDDDDDDDAAAAAAALRAASSVESLKMYVSPPLMRSATRRVCSGAYLSNRSIGTSFLVVGPESCC